MNSEQDILDLASNLPRFSCNMLAGWCGWSANEDRLCTTLVKWNKLDPLKWHTEMQRKGKAMDLNLRMYIQVLRVSCKNLDQYPSLPSLGKWCYTAYYFHIQQWLGKAITELSICHVVSNWQSPLPKTKHILVCYFTCYIVLKLQ